MRLLGVATIVYLLAGGDDVLGPQHARRSTPTSFFGVAFVLLVLEACRRTSGWIITIVVIELFLAYAFVGPVAAGAVGSTAATTSRA